MLNIKFSKMKNYPDHIINSNFRQILKKKIPEHLSAIDEIAVLLDINYDASYRRLNGSVNFSLEEAVKISQKLNISLNDLFAIGDPNSLIVTEYKPILTVNDFNDFLINISKEIYPMAEKEDNSIIFAAKELPVFYFLNQPILIKFQFYLWYTLSNLNNLKKRNPFEQFIISNKLIENAKNISRIYKNINLTEIWSFGAINIILQQLLYLFKIKKINLYEIESICGALISELNLLEEQTSYKNNTKRNFHLYYNEINVNNNSMILNKRGTRKLIYPSTLVNFLIVDHQRICEEHETYLHDQLIYCINICETNIKEHFAFFNNKYNKINQLLNHIKNEKQEILF